MNSIKSDQYSISDLSKEFDITTRTIRFYEIRGYFPLLEKVKQEYTAMAIKYD